jgi:hypothetical protein
MLKKLINRSSEQRSYRASHWLASYLLTHSQCHQAIFFAVTWIDRISTLSVYSRSNDHHALGILTTMDEAGRARREKQRIHGTTSSSRGTENMKATAGTTTPPASSARQGGGGLSWSQSVEMSQHKSQEVRYDCAVVVGGGDGKVASTLLELAFLLCIFRTCQLIHFVPSVSLCMYFSPKLTNVAFPNTDRNIDAKSGSDATRRR